MIGESIEEGLRGESYAVDWVRDGTAADLALAAFTYDLLLLDLGLPGKQGMDVLRALLDNPGSVVSKMQLEEKLYGWNSEVESNTVDVYVHHLRKKFGADFIKNVRGVGYKIPAAP